MGDLSSKEMKVVQELEKIYRNCVVERQRLKKVKDGIYELEKIVQNKGVDEAVRVVKNNELDMDLKQEVGALDDIFKDLNKEEKA